MAVGNGTCMICGAGVPVALPEEYRHLVAIGRAAVDHDDAKLTWDDERRWTPTHPTEDEHYKREVLCEHEAVTRRNLCSLIDNYRIYRRGDSNG